MARGSQNQKRHGGNRNGRGKQLQAKTQKGKGKRGYPAKRFAGGRTASSK